jgi:hypothetical protein
LVESQKDAKIMAKIDKFKSDWTINLESSPAISDAGPAAFANHCAKMKQECMVSRYPRPICFLRVWQGHRSFGVKVLSASFTCWLA